jgi:hypothetical protein
LFTDSAIEYIWDGGEWVQQKEEKKINFGEDTYESLLFPDDEEETTDDEEEASVEKNLKPIVPQPIIEKRARAKNVHGEPHQWTQVKYAKGFIVDTAHDYRVVMTGECLSALVLRLKYMGMFTDQATVEVWNSESDWVQQKVLIRLYVDKYGMLLTWPARPSKSQFHIEKLSRSSKSQTPNPKDKPRSDGIRVMNIEELILDSTHDYRIVETGEWKSTFFFICSSYMPGAV